MLPARPRILHVLNYGWPYVDGYTVRSIGLIEAQHRRGHDVAVAVSPFSPFAHAADRRFTRETWTPEMQLHAARHGADGPWTPHPLERPALGLAPRTSRIFREELGGIVARWEPDLIHAHHPHYVGATAREVALRHGLPFVYEIRCFNGDYDLDRRNPYVLLRGWWQNRLEYRLARQADAVVTISNGLARRLTGAGVPADRVFVVRNSVDTDLFHLRDARRDEPRDVLRLGYATTFEAIENLDVLVRAVPLLRPALRRRGRDVRVTLAGTGRDRPRLRRLVADLGLQDCVELPGFIPYGDMPAFYGALDLFVVPRGPAVVAADTPPLKPLEALACGTPVLASDLPALRELMGGRAGARFVTPSPAAIAEAVLAFAEAPWQTGPDRLDERSWAREVRRYDAAYDAAKTRASVRSAAPDVSGGEDAAPAAWPRRLARRVVRAAADRGLFGLQPLRRHVVICGFPRAGSTLLQLMTAACVEDADTFSGEVDARWAAEHAPRRRAYLVTKRPRDVEQVGAVRAYYGRHPGVPLFVLVIRDPRDVLTSRHAAYPASRGYYVSPQRWRKVFSLYRRLQHDDDVLVVRYEDLTTATGHVQQQLSVATGWTVHTPFEDYHRAVARLGLERDALTEGALGGLRPVESTGVGRWRAREHRGRLREVLDALPDLPEHLVEMGYEPDRAWLETEEQVER